MNQECSSCDEGTMAVTWRLIYATAFFTYVLVYQVVLIHIVVAQHLLV